MIVPAPRLLFWFALIGVPFLGLGFGAPEWLPVCGAVVGLLVTLALFDAARGRAGLRGVRVQLPEIVRMQKQRGALISLQIHNDSQRARTIRVGLPWPRQMEAEPPEFTIALPSGSVASRAEWRCTPQRRGRYLLNAIYLEAASPLGFWAVRARQSAACELRVYPNLFDERKHVAALFLQRGHPGLHARRQSGRGREFEKLREYVPGDGYDEIHWKATARRGHPITKVFQVERTQEVYVLLDASRLSARGEVLERSLNAALMLGVAAEQQGDLFGLITFDSTVRTFIRAKNGQAHFNVCRDALYTLEPREVSPDYEELCGFIRTRLRKRALLIFLTALDDPVLAESFTRGIDLICRQHLILVNMPQPAGVAPVFSQPAATLEAVYASLGGHLLWQKLRELERQLAQRNVGFRLLESDRLSAQVVSQYLNVKARQLL